LPVAVQWTTAPRTLLSPFGRGDQFGLLMTLTAMPPPLREPRDDPDSQHDEDDENDDALDGHSSS